MYIQHSQFHTWCPYFIYLLVFTFKTGNEWCVCMMYNKKCLRINALNHIENLCQDLENIWMYHQRHYCNCFVYWSSWRRSFWGQKWKDLVWIDKLWDFEMEVLTKKLYTNKKIHIMTNDGKSTNQVSQCQGYNVHYIEEIVNN